MTAAALVPQELLDEFVNHLHFDKSSLCMLSLVHRNWLPATRYHLFNSVTLTPQNTTIFLDLLNNTSTPATFQRCVEHLTLKNIPTDMYFRDYSFQAGEPEIAIEPLQEMIQSFPLLRCLELYGVKLSLITSATSFPCHGVLATFKTVAFDVDDEPILSWFFDMGTPSVHCSSIVKDISSTISPFLTRVAPTLQHIKFRFRILCSRYFPEEFCTVLDLHAAINLTSLHLEITSRGAFAAVIKLLSNPKLPEHLREIVLADFTWIRAMADVTEVDWSVLDNAISRPQYAQLETLRFCGIQNVSGEIRDIVSSKMPRCSKRGLLAFCISG